MQHIFTRILLMGINASWILLAVMLFRILFKKAPRWIICFLWIMAGIKLICPFNIESSISLVPSLPGILSASPVNTPAGNGNNITSGQAGNKLSVNIAKKQPGSNTSGTQTGNSTGTAQKEPGHKLADTRKQHINQPANIFTIIWITGVLIFLFYFTISHMRIRKRVSTATHLYGNIWESEFVSTPFILGIIRPGIYIPYNTDNKQLAYILAHENAHLKRKDHILKILAFIILSIYWFHPLVFISYILLCRDIEFACDEKAVSLMDTQEKKEYLLTLLSCSTGKNNISVSPLSFGETGIKERVVHVKKLKKPSLILTMAALITGVIISACFLANPKEQKANGNVIKNKESLDKKTELADYYILKEQAAPGMEIFQPYLSFDQEKKTFCFTYDVLLSYLPTGSYTEEDNKILMFTDDGKYHYTFQKDSKNTLTFIGDSSSDVKLTDKRMGIEIKNGSVFEASVQRPYNNKAGAGLEAKPASVDLNENTGADGVILYYVDAEKIIFGGYFGLFVHDKASGQIVQSLDLEYIGCNYTQGDNYSDIAVSKDGKKIYINPVSQKKLYTFDIASGTLLSDSYNKTSIWDDSSLDLFYRNTEYTTRAVYNDGTEDKICELQEGSNYTIGSCTYSEYSSSNPKNQKESINYPLFPEASTEELKNQPDKNNLYSNEHYSLALPANYTIKETGTDVFIMSGNQKIAGITIAQDFQYGNNIKSIVSNWLGMRAEIKSEEPFFTDNNYEFHKVIVKTELSAAEEIKGEHKKPDETHYFYLSGEKLFIDILVYDNEYITMAENIIKSFTLNV